MTTTIKITELTNIGANLNGNTLVPVVNMNGTPVTQRSNVENLANYVLNTGTGANLGAVGNITITGGNAGEVLTTDGNGVLSWESSSATYSNSNVANYLPTYTGNITGDYIELTHDVNANVVYGNYLYGDGSNITNLPVGNISSINIDGNSSNVLYGNGVFDSVGSPFNQDLNTTDSVTFANITTTEAIRFRNSGNTVGAMGYAPTFLSIESYGSNSVQVTTNDLLTWTFDNVGNLTLPGSLIATTASPAPVINGFSISNAISLSGGNLTTTGTITSTGKIGYSTGGTATQSGSGTSVTINQLTGKITMATRTYNDGDLEVFSLQCNKVENDDMVLIQSVDTVDCASFSVSAYPYTLLANTIRVHMRTTGNLGTYTPVLKFLIVKAPTS